MNRKVMEELERRKAVMDKPCSACNGTGRSDLSTATRLVACSKCLGQRVELSKEEFAMLLEMTFADGDDLLDAKIIE